MCEEHRDLEALPLLERLHEGDPADRDIKERLACALTIRGGTISGAAQAATLVRARTVVALS
jgi:hypothetical protein